MTDTIALTTADGARKRLAADPARTYAQLLALAGVWRDVPACAGLGRCGLCRGRFAADAPKPRAEERKKLSQDELDAGWRLLCLHPALAASIELPEPVRVPRLRTRADEAPGGPVALAVDLGTTGLGWAAWRGKGADARVAAAGSELNPQTVLGSEVMSRIAQALADPDAVRSLVVARLEEIAAELASDVGQVNTLCIAGNSAMELILLGKSVEKLARAPYGLDWTGGTEATISPGLPPAYIPPLLGPFIGADLSAGLTALLLTDAPPKPPFLLADLGTNGECLLALPGGEVLGASVPMGPAIEGVGLAFGRTAGPGAITGFAPSPAGLSPIYFGGTPPSGRPGLSGTGYVSLVAHLRRAGLIDEQGRFAAGSTPAGFKLARRMAEREGARAFDITPDVWLAGADVEELLKVKAAFNLATSRLLAEAGLDATDLTGLYLAGALGEHADLDDLFELGFMPPALRGKVVKSGNTSLAGAGLMLTRADEARALAQALPARCRVLDLAGETNFAAHYVERMTFAHVE